jgi:hypothetical protein
MNTEENFVKGLVKEAKMRIYDKRKLMEVKIINIENGVDDAEGILIDKGFIWNATLNAYKVADVDYVSDYAVDFIDENGGDGKWVYYVDELLIANMDAVEKICKSIENDEIEDEEKYEKLAKELGMFNEFDFLDYIKDFVMIVDERLGFAL